MSTHESPRSVHATKHMSVSSGFGYSSVGEHTRLVLMTLLSWSKGNNWDDLHSRFLQHIYFRLQRPVVPQLDFFFLNPVILLKLNRQENHLKMFTWLHSIQSGDILLKWTVLVLSQSQRIKESRNRFNTAFEICLHSFVCVRD